MSEATVALKEAQKFRPFKRAQIIEANSQMEKLKACPFCAGTDIEYETRSSQGVMVCQACYASGPEAEGAADPECDIEAAEDAWNQRAQLKK